MTRFHFPMRGPTMGLATLAAAILTTSFSYRSACAQQTSANVAVEPLNLSYPEQVQASPGELQPAPANVGSYTQGVPQMRSAPALGCRHGHCGTSSTYCEQSSCWADLKRNAQATHWGYPEYFHERPFGTCNCQAVNYMIANGLRDQQVLYNFDFGTGDQADQLSLRGVYQLEKIVGRIPLVVAPVMIEAIPGNPELNARRQDEVMKKLVELGMPMGPEMVVVGRPRARAFDGAEALPTYFNLLEQARLRGNVGIETSGLTDLGFGSDTSGVAPQTEVNVGQ